VCPVWKSANPAAGTKLQYHPNDKTKALPKEAVATRFYTQHQSLL